MKFGIREVTDITFKTQTANQLVAGTSYANVGTPILFFDSAKTSSVENTVATVYAQGGRGNPRLLAWDGDKVVTFKFEEVLMNKRALAVLTGAKFTSGTTTTKINLHLQEVLSGLSGATTTALLSLPVAAGSFGYGVSTLNTAADVYVIPVTAGTSSAGAGEIGTPILLSYTATLSQVTAGTTLYYYTSTAASGTTIVFAIGSSFDGTNNDYIFDYYANTPTGTNFTVDGNSFGGYYTIEANTLFRGLDGVDYPAQFTIPKGKVKSNFTFSLSPTGDPSTFTFEIDAFKAKTTLNTTECMFSLDILDLPFNSLS